MKQKILIKSTVKQHTRTSKKTGKISNVREHQDSRTKKQAKERAKASRSKQTKSTDDYDEWRNTRINAKHIFRMLMEKYKSDIPKMKQGLRGILKQNRTKPDQEKIIWEEFNNFFKVSKKSMESNMDINIDQFPSLKKAIETTALKSLSFKKTGKEIVDGINAKLVLLRLDLAVFVSNQNIFESNKVTVEAAGSGLDEPVAEKTATAEDWNWKIQSKQREIDKLERYARNLKPKMCYNVDGYELKELGL